MIKTILIFITTLLTITSAIPKSESIPSTRPSTEPCVEGSDGCAVCSTTTGEQNKCRYCQGGYELVNGVCNKCKRGFYSEGGTVSSCKSCNEYGFCKNIANETERDWQCPYYSAVDGSDKCSYCRPGKFTHLKYYNCYNCPEHCLVCKGGHEGGDCMQCEPGYGKKPKRFGCFKCDEGTYSDGTTECLSVYQRDIFVHKTDESGNGYYEYTGSALSDNNANGQNQECDVSKNENVLVNGTCYACKDISKNCHKCQIHSAYDNVVECKDCYAPFVFKNGHCEPCIGNTVYSPPGVGETHGSCVDIMLGCIYQENDKCFECDNGFVLRNNECVLIDDCELASDATCEMCSEGTSLTSIGYCTNVYDCDYSQDEKCLKCESGYQVQTDGSCSLSQTCLSNNGDYCFTTSNKNRVNKTSGKVIGCTNDYEVCITPNSKDIEIYGELDEIELRCNDNHYLTKDSVKCQTDDFCTTANVSDCIVCKTGHYMKKGSCVPIDMPNCTTEIYGYCNVEKTNCTELKNTNTDLTFCLQCENGFTFYNGECKKLNEIKEAMKCINEFNGTNCECEEGKKLDITGCVEIPTGCKTYGYEDKKCLECNRFGKYGKCYSCNEIVNDTCFYIGNIDDGTSVPEDETSKNAPDDNTNTSQNNTTTETTKRSMKQANETTNNTPDELCYAFANTGCLRCIDEYYLINGECKKCPIEGCKSCSYEESTGSTTQGYRDENGVLFKCYDCIDDYIYNKDSMLCSHKDSIDGSCQQPFPNGDGCAICKDKYYRSGGDCKSCNVSCATCVNDIECLTCAPEYFKDDESMQQKEYPLLCLPYSKLENCTKKSQDGCKECDKGFYLEKTRCKKCSENCTLCTGEKVCSQCSKDYIFSDVVKTQCVKVKDVAHCASAGNDNKCGSCENGYELSEDKYSCQEIPPNYGLLIGVPVAVGLVALIILVVICTGIGIAISKCLQKKKILKNISLFEIEKSNITMEELDGPIVSNKQIIDFNEDKEEDLPVNEDEIKELICIGFKPRNRRGRVKIQFTTKEDSYRSTMRIVPSLIELKNGEACEFEVFLKPLCTCEVEDSIVLTVLFISTGEEKTISIPTHFKTQLTSRLDPEELKEERKLGEGSFGIVFLGSFRGNKVAIKKMKQLGENSEENSDDVKNMEEFEREVSMLDKFRNDYVVHFYGACFVPNKICMVTEFATYGSLQDLINKQNQVSSKLKSKMLLDCARGIQYLHGNNILHRDVKPDNFLVMSISESATINCKLTDFGSARNINLLMTNMTFTKGIGTPKYMAPEILNREHYKMPADIFSFAITMYEVFEWNNAYPKTLFPFPWKIADFISSGKRRDKGENMTDQQYELICKCWCQNPKERLEIKDIIDELGKLMKGRPAPPPVPPPRGAGRYQKL